MPAVLKIPSPLQGIVNGVKAVEIPCGTLGQALSHLDVQYPGLKDRLLDEYDEVRPFINIFVNGDDIAYLEGLHTQISDGSEVDIVPSIAGGAHSWDGALWRDPRVTIN